MKKIFFLILLISLTSTSPAETHKTLIFEDKPLQKPFEHPDWFKLSLLDLNEDLVDATKNGKQGIILYFGQQYCSYCNALLNTNFGKPDIASYTQKYFDVIAINIHGMETIIDFDGNHLTEQEYAVKMKTTFTPSLIFIDKDRKHALKLNGYYPPYQFQAALKFVAEKYYLKESFKKYLSRAEPSMAFSKNEMNFEEFFISPPYNFNRTIFSGKSHLAVFFEQGNCHACDILHTRPLTKKSIYTVFNQFETAQLNIWADTPIITPKGIKTTAKKWSDTLGLFYTPSIIFFDPYGNEIIRIDSVTHLYRLKNILEYITTGAYKKEKSFLRWRINLRLNKF
ncbi:MAG: thioredoxin fold domain-containing protein [Methylococcales bacterium]|jgi:thioredoxin-related protein|nr:thioredoxin fold domain-containing protein [Methylococcales bacterium]MBT7410002.1 thioredoxin fold domain-containing protein [Methylococcales bacterium]